MKIFLDCTFLRNEATGVDVTFLNLLKEIACQDTNDNFTIYIDSRYNVNTINDILKLNTNFRIKRIYSILPLQLLYSAFLFPFVLKWGKYDVYHNPYFFGPLWKGLCNKTKVIITVHDLYHRSIPQYSNKLMKFVFRNFGDRAIKKADTIIAISNQTKKDVIRYLNVPEIKINLIYQSLNSKLLSVEEDISILEKNKLSTNQFVLNIGKVMPSKGLLDLIIGSAQFLKKHQDFKLINAGIIADEKYFKELQNKISELELNSQVLFLGYISDNQVKSLYQNCFSVVISSFNEGFGLPALEAFAFQKPLIYRNLETVKEVASNAGLVFVDNEELYKCLENLKNDTLLKTDFVKLGKERLSYFSWKNSAKQTIALYRVK